ncbi:hypothetical protein PUR71_36055 [Streptomyces sp. SP17BM10]|uniref:hypothetical protein n=1 Tax=Streptomyces sp. SP17BM10 TaxID=3002530 RepID=UPI002E76673E|nr:hypothetical protein [Streptomyces sp. SP17BM10]MEE1788272.1 hypothetical protein [Streptomyces sp. SP17BM10]
MRSAGSALSTSVSELLPIGLLLVVPVCAVVRSHSGLLTGPASLIVAVVALWGSLRTIGA